MTTASSPRPSARVRHTSIVCGWHLLWEHSSKTGRHQGDWTVEHEPWLCQKKLTETRNFGFLPRAMALHMVMASAAAVASSNKDALDIGIPVRSHTIVWKVSSVSSLQQQGHDQPAP